MAKTKLAKKRRLARAHAHQEKTRTTRFISDAIAEVWPQDHTDPWPDQKSQPSSVGYAMAPVARALTGKAEKERVAVVLAELQAEVNAGGEARILSTQRRRTASTPATMAQVAESDAIARAAEGVPNRAKCRHCSKSQKVKKDGRFGKHDGTRGGQCAGVDELWWNGVGHDGGAI